MSYDDPFADAPADEAQAATTPQPPAGTQAAPAAVKSAAVVAAADTGLSVTFKGDGSYSAPWLVPKYGSVAEALVDLGAPPAEVDGMTQAQRWMALFDRASKMAAHFAKLGGGSSAPANSGGGGGQQRQSNAPQAAKEAPNGEERFCKHGKMEYKTGISKSSGKPYELFSCTGPRNEQCDAQWPNRK